MQIQYSRLSKRNCQARFILITNSTSSVFVVVGAFARIASVLEMWSLILSTPFVLLTSSITFTPFFLAHYMCSVSDPDCRHLFSMTYKLFYHFIFVIHTYVLHIISFLHFKSHQIFDFSSGFSRLMLLK